MGWLITGGIVLLLAVLPLGVKICYDAGGLLVWAKLGPVRLTLYPRANQEPKQKRKPEKAPSSGKKPGGEGEDLPKPPRKPQPKPEAKAAGTGGSLLDFLPLVELALEFLGDFRRKLRLDDLYLRLILAGGDPCDLAVNYGRTWAAVGNLLPQLERLFVIKNRDIEVECDFTASQTLVTARADVTITLGYLLALAAVYGVRALIQFFKIKKAVL